MYILVFLLGCCFGILLISILQFAGDDKDDL